ncbi:MAG: hypothetical protein CML43_00650 [Rhodobacteraceae bacterium]|nr:hypothetical protein [Paracoccaceae bacterium]
MTGHLLRVGRANTLDPRQRIRRRRGALSALAAALILSGCSEEVSEDDMVKAMSCVGAVAAAEPAAISGVIPISRDELLSAVLAFGNFMAVHGQDVIDQHRAEGQRIDVRATNAAVASRTEVEAMNRQGWTEKGIGALNWCIRFLHDLPDSDRRIR